MFHRFDATQVTGNTMLIQTDLTSLSGTSAAAVTDSIEKVTVMNQNANEDYQQQLMHQQQ
jgi:hypothetical protein